MQGVVITLKEAMRKRGIIPEHVANPQALTFQEQVQDSEEGNFMLAVDGRLCVPVGEGRMLYEWFAVGEDTYGSQYVTDTSYAIMINGGSVSVQRMKASW